MKRICFVTDELHPVTAGGIGRLLHNLILHSLCSCGDLEFHLLAPTYSGISPDRVRIALGDRVKVHPVELRSSWDVPRRKDGHYPPSAAFSDSSWHGESHQICLELKKLEEAGLEFDFIEFPDYRGWAFCALQEKRLGLGLHASRIVVRLHSTLGIIHRLEPGRRSLEDFGRFELERKALQDAELVISHLPAIAPFNANFYGFGSEWLERVQVEFPPVVFGAQEPRRSESEAVPPRDPDMVFATKIQPCKAPELFLRGCVEFMRRQPDYSGRAVFSCHAFDSARLEALRRLVPRGLESRFLFLHHLGPGEREALIRKGLVVIPSAYESLNLTAYEASAMGAKLLLNGACPAFGGDSPWRDGENCFKFEPLPGALAEALQRAWKEPRLQPVKWTADFPYWERPREAARPAEVASGHARVSVVITNYNLGEYLPTAIESVIRSEHPDVEIVVVDDASTNQLDAVILERLEREQSDLSPRIRVIRNSVNRGLAASRNRGIRAATGKYVVPLDADDVIAPGFFGLASRALERQPNYDVVVPALAYFESDRDLEQGKFCDYAMFLGDVPSLGLAANRLSSATSMIRRSVFEKTRYNELLSSYEDWDLYLRLALLGRRFLVTNAIHFFYRRRPGSMICGVTRERHLQLLTQIWESLPPLPAASRVAPVIGIAFDAGRESGNKRGELSGSAALGRLRQVRNRVAQAANLRLKSLAPPVHRFLKSTVGKSSVVRRSIGLPQRG